MSISNIKSNIKIHNSYHYKLIKTDGTVVKEDTVYNSASSRIYVADIGSGSTISTTLRIYYHGFYINEDGERATTQEEYCTTTGISFQRVTKPEEISYGTAIHFIGMVEFAAGNGFTGSITKFALGGEQNIYEEGEDGKKILVDTVHWSEANGGGEKDETTAAIITVNLYITANAPTGLPYIYDENNCSILKKYQESFPSPGISWIGLSSIPLETLSTTLHKKLPIIDTIPTVMYHSYELGKPNFSIVNTVSATTEEHKDMLYLGSNSWNFGTLRTMVFGNVGAMPISGRWEGEPVIMPAAKLNAQSLSSLLLTDKEEFFFFVVAPEGCSAGSVTVNGTTGESAEGVSFVDPRSVSDIGISAIGVTDTEEVSIEQYKNTDVGEYYANYLFGDYWEPPTGSAVCPQYIYFTERPTNIYAGKNCSATIQAFVDNKWVNVGASESYKTIYLSEVENAARYRAVVSAPPSNSTNFYINNVESAIIPYKTYDPFVLRIGGADGDFGRCGIRVPRETIQHWYDSLLEEQTTTTYYVIGITIIPNGVFYKTANVLSYIKYGAYVYGN